MKKFLTIAAVLLLPGLLLAQSYVHGTVTDVRTGQPLIGANVVANGEFATVTDENGDYVIKPPVKKGDTLSVFVTHLGYAPQAFAWVREVFENTQHFALQPDVRQLQDVVVSASKQPVAGQQVPMAISTVLGSELQRSGDRQFRDIASGLPNLSFGTQGTGRFSNGIDIRGIQGPNTAAIYLDESLLAENIDPRLVDVARVEILHGAQGTLYGSRNLGGAVRVVTNRPHVRQVEGSAGLSLGTVREGSVDFGLDGMLNVPIGKKIAFRAVGYTDFESGVFDRKIDRRANLLSLAQPVYGTYPDGRLFTIATDGCAECNIRNEDNVDAERNYGFRAGLAYFPIKGISIFPSMTAQRQSGDGYDFAEGEVGNFTRLRVAGVPETFSDNWKNYNLLVEFGLGFGKLISTTSYLDRTLDEQDDYGETTSRNFGFYDGGEGLDFFAGTLSQRVASTQFNHEFRFRSELRGDFNFSLGAFYRDTRERTDRFAANTGAGSYIALYVQRDPDFAEYVEQSQLPMLMANGDTKEQEMAFFGEANYEITSRLTATFGLRYFRVNQELAGQAGGFVLHDELLETSGNREETGFSPKLNLRYQLDRNRLLYVAVSHGYRLGGLNGLVPTALCANELPNGTAPSTFEPDELWTYEAGFKSTWAKGKLMANAAIFYNDWQNMQLARQLDCGYGYLTNAGAAHTAGLELELRAKPTARWEIGAGLGLLDATIDEDAPDFAAEKGDRLPFTPQLTANANAQYTFALDPVHRAYVRLGAQHVGERFNTFEPESPKGAHLTFDAYTLLDASIGLQFLNYEVSIFGKNLTNTAANFGNIHSLAGEVEGRPRFATNRPVMLGMRARASF